MSNMILCVEITYKDDKIETFNSVDFPAVGSEWLTLYLPNFERKIINVDSIHSIRQYFKFDE